MDDSGYKLFLWYAYRVHEGELMNKALVDNFYCFRYTTGIDLADRLWLHLLKVGAKRSCLKSRRCNG